MWSLHLNTLQSHSVRVLTPVATVTHLTQVVHNFHQPQFECCHFQILHYHPV
jgi:hypothetical protein